MFVNPFIWPFEELPVQFRIAFLTLNTAISIGLLVSLLCKNKHLPARTAGKREIFGKVVMQKAQPARRKLNAVSGAAWKRKIGHDVFLFLLCTSGKLF